MTLVDFAGYPGTWLLLVLIGLALCACYFSWVMSKKALRVAAEEPWQRVMFDFYRASMWVMLGLGLVYATAAALPELVQNHRVLFFQWLVALAGWLWFLVARYRCHKGDHPGRRRQYNGETKTTTTTTTTIKGSHRRKRASP